MQAIRVTRTLDLETIYLPQLRPLLGQQVEIIVLTADASVPEPTVNEVSVNPLAGSVQRYDDPFEPAAPVGEWEANQ